ncbi:AsmA family protein [Dechloromonas denitrificans]|uniref:AsmA family protein n=1 Tax=Dechloromonas denitrificans TaxID=281362 RepID=UPI001CF866B0|nr:AsmA family protein [Dechloromonas denitrificans]UCV01786.1 AsmA family protein [Dechloromonas denitrificans]
MDPKLVYAKTPMGDEAVRQSTRVVQRNLRMVLVQVDGKLTIEELSVKMENPRMVESALRELEEGGFIAPRLEAASVWAESGLPSHKEQVSALSQFSTFGPKSLSPPDRPGGDSRGGKFSFFGKPILPSPRNKSAVSSETVAISPRKPVPDEHDDDGKRIPLLKWGLLGLAGAVLLLLGLVLFYPYADFKPAIEAAASRLLQTPVKVGHVGMTLLPQPQLNLADVRIGEAGDSRIETIHIASPFALLGSGPQRISRVDVVGAVLSANRLVALPMFGAARGAAADEVVIRRLRIERSAVTVRDIALRDIAGEIIFKADGSVEKAAFQAVDRSIRLAVVPTPQGLLLNIEGLAWKPAGMPVSFDSLQAKGLLQKNKLLIQSIDTTFLGGILKGNWLLDWSNGLVMAGDASLHRIDCRQLSAAFVPTLKLEGDLGGTLRLRAGGNDWASMWNSLEGMLDADITRGVLYGVDLGEVARRGGGSAVRSGATKFDRLRTNITINPGQVSGRDIRLDAGMMTATGQFLARRDRPIDATLSIGIQTSVSSRHVPVHVSGMLPDLTASGSK